MSKGIFIEGITVEMFRNASLEAVETLLNEGYIEDVEIPRWIPCSERLPEIGEKGTSDMVLLCWSDGQRTVGAYQGNRTFVGQAWPEARSCRVTVTAWMPLPEPYKGGADVRGEQYE